MRPAVLAVSILLTLAGPASAVEAAYTELDLGACEIEEVFEAGGGAILRCAGLSGIPVFVSEGDLRFDVDFGARDENFDSFVPFNSIGTRIEWRLDGDASFAAILRFSIDYPPDTLPEPRRGSVLAIYKTGDEETAGCPIAYVDAVENPNANLIARQVADGFARAFRCGRDRATYVGATGPLSGNATAVDWPR